MFVRLPVITHSRRFLNLPVAQDEIRQREISSESGREIFSVPWLQKYLEISSRGGSLSF